MPLPFRVTVSGQNTSGVLVEPSEGLLAPRPQDGLEDAASSLRLLKIFNILILIILYNNIIIFIIFLYVLKRV